MRRSRGLGDVYKRQVQDERIDRKNESLMSMTPEIITILINTVIGKE
jgi:hypothetical protein